MEYKNPLGEEKIYKLILKFSIPAIVGMVVNALYNIVDRIFIGNSSDLGKNGLAGITFSFPLMIILLAVGILSGIGGATLFSIKLGEKKIGDAEHTLGNAFFMLVFTSILIMIIGQIFLKPILLLFGTDEVVLPYSIEYMRIIFMGAIFQIVSMGMNNFIRADGNPKKAMYTMFLGAGINILLDPIFIYVFRMGMTGAALATILSQCISAIWVVYYFIGKSSKSKLHLKYIIPKLSIIASIIVLGLPGFFLQLANSLLNIALNKNLLLYGGNTAVSGMGVINSLLTFLIMPVIGLKQGTQPIISYNYGAKKYDRVKTTVNLAILIATGIVFIGYMITRLFPEQLITLFNRDPELLDFGRTAVMSWFLMFPVVGFQIIASNYFQAIGQPKSAILLTLSRQVILLIPAILIFPKFWGMEGLLHAAPFADFFSAFLTGIWFLIGMKTLGKKQTS